LGEGGILGGERKRNRGIEEYYEEIGKRK